MEEKYFKYLSNFIFKKKRERIIFELLSENKRENAFCKMTDFSSCFLKENILFDLSHFEDNEAIAKIEGLVSGKECFDLKYRKIDSIKNAYQRAVDSYMFNLLIVDDKTAIYIGECSYGASDKYILKINK